MSGQEIERLVAAENSLWFQCPFILLVVGL